MVSLKLNIRSFCLIGGMFLLSVFEMQILKLQKICQRPCMGHCWCIAFNPGTSLAAVWFPQSAHWELAYNAFETCASQLSVDTGIYSLRR